MFNKIYVTNMLWINECVKGLWDRSYKQLFTDQHLYFTSLDVNKAKKNKKQKNLSSYTEIWKDDVLKTFLWQKT